MLTSRVEDGTEPESGDCLDAMKDEEVHGSWDGEERMVFRNV